MSQPNVALLRRRRRCRLRELGSFALFLLAGTYPGRSADLYWRVDGGTALITSASWSTNAAAPYTSAWVNGSNLLFTADSAMTYVTGTAVGNITISNGVTVTWGKAGTLTTGGAVRTVNIGTNGRLLWDGQGVSSTAGTGFIKDGAGTWDLGAIANGYSGGFTLNAGLVVVGGINSLGNGGALNLNGGTLAPNTGTTRDLSNKFTAINFGGDVQLGDSVRVPAGTGGLTFSSNVALGGTTRTITIGGSGEYSFTGNIGGGGGLIVARTSGGTGTLVLSGSNSYSGPTTVSGGVLRLNSVGALPSASNLRLNGGVLELGTDAPAAFALGTGGAEVEWNGDGGFAASGADRVLTLNAGGQLTWGSGGFVPSGSRLLLGSATSTRTITLTNDIQLGSVSRAIVVAQSLGPSGSASASLTGKLTGAASLMINGGGWLSLSGNSDYAGGTSLVGTKLTVANDHAIGTGPLQLGDGVSTAAAALVAGGVVTLANDIVLTAGPAAPYAISGVSGTSLTLAGDITGNGPGISYVGTGTIVLRGQNSFAGVAELQNGTVTIGSNAALGSAAVHFSTVVLQSDGSARTISNAGTFSSFSIGGGSDLSIAGKLTNKSPTFTGTLTITNTGLSSFGAIDLSADSSFRTVAFVTGAGARAVVNGKISNGPLSSFGGISKSGPGKLTLLAANTYSGATVVTDGTLEIAVLADGSLPSGIGQSTSTASNLILSNATLRYIGAGADTNRLFQLGQGAIAASATIDSSGSGPVSFAGSGSLTYGSSGHARSLNLSGNNTGNNVFTPAVGDNGSAATSMTKSGQGKWTVAGANTFTGGITLESGTLRLGSAGALGNTGSISFLGGTLQYSSANSIDYSPRFSNTPAQLVSIDTDGQSVTFASPLNSLGGTLTKLGTGTLTLRVDSTFDGGTFVRGGTLRVGGPEALGSGSIDLQGGTLQVEGGVAFTKPVSFLAPTSRYELLRNAGDDLAGYQAGSSLGGVETTAELLAGTALMPRTLETGFGTTSAALNDPLRLSDVFQLSGTGADPFVLQLSLEGMISIGADIWLNSLDGAGLWQNAVLANGSNTASALQRGFVGSFAGFQLINGGDLTAYSGAYGIDQEAHAVWAVLDHGGTFAIVPEIGPGVFLAIALAGVVCTKRTRPTGGRDIHRR